AVVVPCAMAGVLVLAGCQKNSSESANAPANHQTIPTNNVTVSEDQNYFTLDNGIVTARISKKSGDLFSLKYKNLELLDNVDQHQPAYWSHNTALGQQIIPDITIDPKSNGGERGEVSVKGISGGSRMGSGPGGSVVADIEIRYSLGRTDSGI